MINEGLINTIIAAGLTGAGLIFASYGIMISFSDKITKFKQDRIKEARKKIKSTKSTKELREYLEEVESREMTPLYLTQAVYAIFILYILSVLFGLAHTYGLESTMWGEAAIWSFVISTTLFGLTGISMLQDFLEFMRHTMGVINIK